MNQGFLTQYIYVFGSYRKFLKLQNYFKEKKYNLIFISGENSKGIVKTKKQLLNEFKTHYNRFQTITAFISFGKGSLIGSIEAIAETFSTIKKTYPDLFTTQFIGPSQKAAKIFCNKYLTHKTLLNIGIPTPFTQEILGNSTNEILSIIPNKISFPLIIKAEDLSGGRGIKYIENLTNLHKSIKHFFNLGIKKFILTEYVSGVEATFTVFRLGEVFMRLPTSYKIETTKKMIHPDSKVKITGIYKEFNEYFEFVEKIMKKYDISGFFSLQGVLKKKKNQYSVIFLEAAPRMTGSTPIMESSLIDFNIFATIALWLKKKKIKFAYSKRMSLQYSTYIHNKKETVKILKKQNWIVEAKYEDLGKMSLSEDKRNRIRISFFIDNINTIDKKLNIIANICKNKSYTSEVKNVLSWFNKNHKFLTNTVDKKVLEGFWGKNSHWEFYLSSTLPNKKLCTAIFGVPKFQNGILLTKTARGWELPGGHREKGEEVFETLTREIFEETGFKTQRAIIYGYRKIIVSKILYRKKGESYPFPISYIPHFLVASDLKLKKTTGKEVLGNGFFLNKAIEIKKSHVSKIIKIAIKELNRIG